MVLVSEIVPSIGVPNQRHRKKIGRGKHNLQNRTTVHVFHRRLPFTSLRLVSPSVVEPMHLPTASTDPSSREFAPASSSVSTRTADSFPTLPPCADSSVKKS